MSAHQEVPRVDVAQIVAALIRRQLSIACAESLTGGALTSTLVGVPGVSEILRGGIISYATDVKASVLGVSQQRLSAVGPVDGQVAIEMARGACRVLQADVALATTGVAGPGAADGHPAGTVWIAIAGFLGEEARLLDLSGDRAEIRRASITCALGLLAEHLESNEDMDERARKDATRD